VQVAREEQPNPPKMSFIGNLEQFLQEKEALFFGQSVNFVRSPQKNYASI
jgi:hypothetical protein